MAREVSAPMRCHLERVRNYFGEMRAMGVTKRHVEDFVALLKNEGKQNGTINRATQLLGQAFRIAAAADPPKVLRHPTIRKLDESENVRKGKFSEREAQRIFFSLPPYMADVARFAYETGVRSGEILKLRWDYLQSGAIRVPAKDAKNRTAHSIALTPELERIIARRGAARADGCELVFHHDGQPIRDYRKSWQSACCINGLGQLFCRACRNDDGEYTSPLDANRRCPNCGQKSDNPKYIGRVFHDFRRSCAHEMWKAGSTIEDCMQVTGHRTRSMFLRYADLFSDEEKQTRQREVQRRRHEWRQAEAEQAERLASSDQVGRVQ